MDPITACKQCDHLGAGLSWLAKHRKCASLWTAGTCICSIFSALDEQNAHLSGYASTLTDFDDTSGPVLPSDRFQPRPSMITRTRRGWYVIKCHKLFCFCLTHITHNKTTSSQAAASAFAPRLLFVLPPAGVSEGDVKNADLNGEMKTLFAYIFNRW